jgi:hypothetical protein
VDNTELVFGALLVVLLLGLAGFYSWRQIRMLRTLGRDSPGSSSSWFTVDERRYLRRQAWRRIASSVLMVLFAGLLVGSYFVEGALASLHEGAEQSAQPNPEQRAFIYFYSWYWIVGILLFFGILVLAAIDLLATRRFTVRQLKQMQDGHQVLLNQQAAQLRMRRNGSG